MGLRRSWDAYNNAKARRVMERTALEAVPVPCEDCGSRGVDPGSLHQPEECPSCCGSGGLVSDRIERKGMGAATSALPESVNLKVAGRTKP